VGRQYFDGRARTLYLFEVQKMLPNFREETLESSGEIRDMTLESQIPRVSEIKENPNPGMMPWMYRLTGR
jgi:hypothetical protein